VAAVVDSAAVVAVVESAIAGKRLALIETPKESPAQTFPNLHLDGIRGAGRNFSRKQDEEVLSRVPLSADSYPHFPLDRDWVPDPGVQYFPAAITLSLWPCFMRCNIRMGRTRLASVIEDGSDVVGKPMTRTAIE
jgi:hypothetical protein